MFNYNMKDKNINFIRKNILRIKGKYRFLNSKIDTIITIINLKFHHFFKIEKYIKFDK